MTLEVIFTVLIFCSFRHIFQTHLDYVTKLSIDNEFIEFSIIPSSGDKKRRDFIQNITYVPKLDIFISSSEKGVVCQWSSKVNIFIILFKNIDITF